MKIEKKLLPKVYSELWNVYKIGLSDAEYYTAILIDENYFPHDVKNENDISSFLKNIAEPYFFPSGFDRRSVYEASDLNSQKIVLKEVGAIPDGWDCKLYFDSSNNLYWEDNFGKCSIEGLRVSPYMDPIKKYKMT